MNMKDLEALSRSDLLSILKESILENRLGASLGSFSQSSVTSPYEFNLDHVTQLIEQDKLQMAREIHDDLCPQLLSIEMALNSLQIQPSLSESERREKISNLLKIVHSALLNARTMTAGLNLSKLKEVGLSEALSSWIELLDAVLPIKLVFSGCSSDITLAHDTSVVHAYRIAQEAIQNALKHSKATLISVRLELRNRDLILTIQDNGIGFKDGKQKNGAGQGVTNMRFRSEFLGARLNFKENDPQGLKVVCEIPSVLAKP